MNSKLFFLVVGLVLCIGSPAWSIETEWVARFNGPQNSHDRPAAIALDDLGNVYVTGYSHFSWSYPDFCTIKYRPNGDTAWVRNYNGPDDAWDEAVDIAVDASGCVYVTGNSNSNASRYDYVTVKYDSSGSELWVRRYNGPGNHDDLASAIAVDNLGNVYVTGGSHGEVTKMDYATIKYYPYGDTAWVRRYAGVDSASDVAHDIAVDSSGNVYVTGSATVSGTIWDYVTIKYDSAGELLWTEAYDGPAHGPDDASAIALDTAGNVYVTGASYSSSGYEDYGTIKYLPNGDTVWVRRLNGPASYRDNAYDLALDQRGNLYVTGRIGTSSG